MSLRHAHDATVQETYEVLHQCLEALPEMQRAVIMMRFFDGYTDEEIAQALCLSPHSVRAYRSAALRSALQ